MTVDSTREDNVRHAPVGALWVGIALAPAAWFLQLAVGYSLVPMVCEHGAAWMLHLTSALALTLALGGFWMAFLSWRAAPAVHGADTGSDAVEASSRRIRFMATAGMMLSAFFAFTVGLAWIPSFIVESCGSI